ncbi:MAG: SagB/ThcOx family dehydrogenase [Deltaproteobacteria bacterium]|nr:SagB/ThcOx family dehydrogenase [Deltaproteobacteria bacterium]
MDDRIRSHRRWLKDTVRGSIDWNATGQSLGLPLPPLQKPVPPGSRTIALPGPDRFDEVCRAGLLEVLHRRRSVRRYADAVLSIEELAFLLWGTQGVARRDGDESSFRTVPSAGARHAFETYLYCRKVGTLEEGIYRYLPLSHKLLFEFAEPGLSARIANACLGQRFVGQGAATFFWSVLPYRMEWRYGAAAHRVLPMDAGHVCQNLYLCAEAIGAGTCAVAAYDQEAVDALLRLDGMEEFVIYLAPVGRRAASA